MRFPHHHHSGHCHASEHGDHHGRPCVRPDFPFGGGGGGGKRERIFASGGLKFVVRHLLASEGKPDPLAPGERLRRMFGKTSEEDWEEAVEQSKGWGG